MLTAIAAVVLMASLFSRGLGSQWQRAIVPHLYQYVTYIRNDLGSPPDESRARELSARLPIEIQVHSQNPDAMVFTTRNTPLVLDNIRFFKPRRLLQRHTRALEQGDRIPLDNIAISEGRRSVVLRMDVNEYQIFIEFTRPRGRERDHDELLLAIAGLALLLGLCYFAIRHLLKPIGRLQATVSKISMGDLTARTYAKGSGDLERLSNSVDEMSGRIQQMLDAKRELLLAISHELRSPLTRARLATELLEPSRHQHKLVQDIDEMESLIAALVESERLQNHVVLDLHRIDLNKIISDIVGSFDTSITWNASVTPCLITADEARLHVLVRNVIDNALQYGKSSESDIAEVTVQLDANDTEVKVTITDNGPGIDSGHLDSVTEPFYRPDASRTRQTGGMGLGLYLCLRIAQAHGGNLTIESPQNENIGVRATISLPRIPSDAKG